MLYLSQMNKNMTRLTDTLSVTNDHGYDYAIRYFICHKWSGIWI